MRQLNAHARLQKKLSRSRKPDGCYQPNKHMVGKTSGCNLSVFVILKIIWMSLDRCSTLNVISVKLDGILRLVQGQII